MRNLIRLALDLGHKLFSRLRAMGRMGRRVTPRAPVWGWALIWLRSSFLPSQNYLIILAVVVGILTGYGSVGFVMVLHILADFARGTISEVLAIFGPAQLVLLPALGGLMVGPLINRFAKEAKGHGVPEVMTALATRGGLIRLRVVVVKVIASSLTIGFGGTAGREGPMVQIGSALGSAIGKWARLTTKNIRTLVACGAAGGVAATFNAPIAGAIFAMEVLMGRIQTDFLLVLLTSLSSSIIARHYLGNAPAVLSPSYYLVSPGELPLYFLMGIIIGVAAVYYVKLLYASEDLFGDWNFPEYLKPAVGGLLVGLILRFFPEVYGSGFPAIESALWTRYTWGFLLCLFAAEMLANCATLGSGGSGGVFAPSLYMGAMLGGAFGAIVHSVFPDWTATSGAYAMVGMAAFFAAAAKAPTTSILILFEMTGDYHIMLPLMAATVGSVYLSHRLMPHSIYILKLNRGGIAYPYSEEDTDSAGPPTMSVRPPVRKPAVGD
jgi:CIC family chloride channel protein